MVLPEEAELLALAEQLGALTFTLRNEDDLDVLEERGRATLSTLLSGERTKVLQQKRFNTIQVIRGAAPPTNAPVRSK
jgi:pilus assembly protein CpaB